MLSIVTGFLFSRTGKIVAGIVAIMVGIGGVYIKGRSDGKQVILDKLADDRITILKDGEEIDNEVFSADDDALCAFLGGCLPD